MTINNQELEVVVDKAGLEKTKGEQLINMFVPYFREMAEIEKKINSLNAEAPTSIDIKISKDIRLALRDNRVKAEKLKTELKAGILIEGNVINHLYGLVRDTSKPLESKCEQIEKFAEIQEQKRKEEERIKRLELLKPYEVEDGFFAFNYDLLNMSETAFNDLLSGAKLNLEKRKEAERLAEEERIAREKADAEEKERARIQLEKLKAESERVKKEFAREKAKADKRAAELMAQVNAEREVADKRAAELKAKADADRKAKEELEKRLLEKEEQEKAEIAKQKADARKLARQPDKKRLQSFASFIQAIEMPDIKSVEAMVILSDVQNLLNKVAKFINDKAETL